MRSFQGHWHFISGGMELGDRGDPVRRAYRHVSFTHIQVHSTFMHQTEPDPPYIHTSNKRRELEEEVQLLPQHVTLVARGRPLLVAPPR